MTSLQGRIRRGDLHPARLSREILARDVAYCGFLACGAVFAGALALNLLPTGSWLYLALEQLFRLPVLALFAAGAPLGIGLTIRLWRETALPALALLTLAVPVVPWAGVRWPAPMAIAAPLFLGLYTLLAVALPLRWLVRDRRRLRRRYPRTGDARWM